MSGQKLLILDPIKRLGVNKLKQKNQKGFTLIELLVVIAIIGLLASVVLLALNSARQKSRDAKRLADIRQIASAAELYFDAVNPNGYPTSVAALTGQGSLATWPTTPTPADGTCTTTQNAYTYSSSGGSTYSVAFCLGAATGGISAGVHTLTQAGIQ